MAGPALPRERETLVQLLPGRDVPLRAGRRWVYRTEVNGFAGEDFEPGDVVKVIDARGRLVGKGYVNPRSAILVRLLTEDPDEPVDEEFFARRIQRAWNYRRRVLEDTGSCRVVFGEADLLPGLIVDKYEDVLVVQTLALGIERWRPVILRLLDDLFMPLGIYERNDVRVREREGLPQRAGFIKGPFDTRVRIRENGIPFWVDVACGHKTGHFLDQRENRAALRPYVRGARVLDVFCHTGGFAVHAAVYGAASVDAVDASADALALARDNAELAGVADRIAFHEADAFAFLRERAAGGPHYDVVILDPPAFAKSRQALEGAYRGYKEINLRAMRLLVPGGILVTCSCSSPVTPEMFQRMLADAAADAGRRLRLVERRGQARDHPVLWGQEESQYLKCYVVEVL